MCDVCVASAALRRSGTTVKWDESPVAVQVRARGAAEVGPATYQIRRVGSPWPRAWSRTTKKHDLAAVMGAYGFDVVWGVVPPVVRKWVLKGGRLPRLNDARASGWSNRSRARAWARAKVEAIAKKRSTGRRVKKPARSGTSRFKGTRRGGV